VAVAVAAVRILAQSEQEVLVAVVLVEKIQAQPPLMVKQILVAVVAAKVAVRPEVLALAVLV